MLREDLVFFGPLRWQSWHATCYGLSVMLGLNGD